MAGIELPEAKQQSMELDFGTKMRHSQLKNLSFEESGHRGFQKELTEEQLELIEKVKNKEDVSNRVTDISDKNTHEQYPSAKAVFDIVNECGKMELIDSTELTEDVAQISPTMDGQYKELYIFLKMPPQADVATNTEKARMSMWNGNTMIYDQAAVRVDNYNMDWYIVCTVKMYGTRCYSQMWYAKYHEQASGIIIPYAVPSTNQNYAGAVCPHMQLNNPYLDTIAVKMSSQTAGARAFPKGTTYELWGVRK